MESLQAIASELIQVDGNIWGVCVVNNSGQIVYQTDNWDLSGDIGAIMGLTEGVGSIELVGIRYVVVENIPERVIGTNVTGKGHVIICPAAGKGKVVCYVKPDASPREAVLNAMNYSRKIGDYL